MRNDQNLLQNNLPICISLSTNLDKKKGQTRKRGQEPIWCSGQIFRALDFATTVNCKRKKRW